MDIGDHLRARVADFSERLSELRRVESVPGRFAEAVDRLALVQSLWENMPKMIDREGHISHPFSEAPFLSSMIWFHLDRCEELLKETENIPSWKKNRSENAGWSIYPSIGAAFLRAFFNFLIYVRGRLLGYQPYQDQINLWEILYPT